MKKKSGWCEKYGHYCKQLADFEANSTRGNVEKSIDSALTIAEKTFLSNAGGSLIPTSIVKTKA